MVKQEKKRGRGRPVSQMARDRILEAARAMLAEGGVTSITMDGLAGRAGVGKPTIYRSWANRHEVVMAALMQSSPPTDVSVANGVPLAELARQLSDVAAFLAGATGRHVASMLASADESSEISRAFRSHFLQARREEGRVLLQAAKDRGEIASAIDMEIALDLIYGPIFYRLLMGHGRIDRRYTDKLLQSALAGLGARAPAR